MYKVSRFKATSRRLVNLVTVSARMGDLFSKENNGGQSASQEKDDEGSHQIQQIQSLQSLLSSSLRLDPAIQVVVAFVPLLQLQAFDLIVHYPKLKHLQHSEEEMKSLRDP